MTSVKGWHTGRVRLMTLSASLRIMVMCSSLLSFLFFLFFFFHLTYSRWTSSLPSCLWSQKIFPSFPGSRLTIFLSRCKFSTLTTRQPMVEFYLLKFPRFPLRKKEHKSYFGVRIELTTSVLADVQLTYYSRPLGRRLYMKKPYLDLEKLLSSG